MQRRRPGSLTLNSASRRLTQDAYSMCRPGILTLMTSGVSPDWSRGRWVCSHVFVLTSSTVDVLMIALLRTSLKGWRETRDRGPWRSPQTSAVRVRPGPLRLHTALLEPRVHVPEGAPVGPLAGDAVPLRDRQARGPGEGHAGVELEDQTASHGQDPVGEDVVSGDHGVSGLAALDHDQTLDPRVPTPASELRQTSQDTPWRTDGSCSSRRAVSRCRSATSLYRPLADSPRFQSPRGTPT